MRITVRILVVALLAFATSLQAITYLVPSDRDLVKRAEAIIIATAVESHAELDATGGVVTIAALHVERTLKGRIGDTIDLTEPGGSVGEISTMIPGSPRYEAGKRYLIFLMHNNRGQWATYGFGLGRFEFVDDLHGRTIVTRGDTAEGLFGFEEGTWAPHRELLRGGPEFVTFVATMAASNAAPARTDYVIDPSQVVFASFPEFRPRAAAFISLAAFGRPDYLVSGNFRWQSPNVTFDFCCSISNFQPGLDGPGALAAATANWHNAGAGINYGSASSENTSATGGLPGLGRGFFDSQNAVLFNDPFGDFAASGVPSGVVGIGGISKTAGTYKLADNVTYNNTTEGDVVIANSATLSGVSQTTFVLVLTHELGHTLGFRHSDGTNDPNSPANGQHCNASTSPCADPGSAVMASTVFSSLSGLKQWDLDAAQTVYGSGPVCTAPAISGQPIGVTINSGQQTTLTVTATGTSPTYQWYIGNPPSTTTTAPNGTSSQLTVSPTTTTTYWVKVSGCSTSVNSNAATVTVNPPACTPPSAGTPTATPSSIQSGQSSTLAVTATGTGPLSYQWFIGATPVGTGSSISVSPTATTTYFVRVTGQCSPVSDSQTVTVTVASCVAPSASTPNASPSSITAGQTSTLTANVSGTGPFTYQWFNGATLIGTTVSINVTPTVTTSYFVRVTGPCGSPSDSPTVTVTVAACVPPSTSSPNASPSSITSGQSSTLTVNVSGTAPFSYQWFSGTPANPTFIGSGTSISVNPTVTTSYFVRVTGPCGSPSDSPTVTVTVTTCTAVSITTQPSSATITPGSSTTLSVIAAGTAPISYQWYQGTSGDTSHPINNATGSSVTVTPATTTSYWVHVSNSCNAIGVNSTAAVVTLSTTCTSPTITTQPASVSAPLATVATLKVVATGTGLHYQWYKGVRSDISNKVGTDSDTFATGPLLETASYWVRVTNDCGSSTDSNAAVITPGAPLRGRAVRH
jgi:hypothetical protein